MSGRAKRLVAASGVALAVGAGGAVLAAGTASAATPIVVGSCNTSIKGAPGTPVSLSLSNLLGVAALPTIPIGSIGNGTQTLNAVPQITAALNKIPLAGPLLNTVLGTGCEITTKAVNAAAAPIQPITRGAGSAVDNGVQQLQHALNPHQGNPPGDDPGKQGSPGTGGNPGTTPGTNHDTPPPLGMPNYQGQGLVGAGVPFTNSLIAQYGTALSPQERYGNIPFATPGLFAMSPGVRYGGEIPGYAPQFQALGTHQRNDAHNPVRTAGRAEALHGDGLTTDGAVGLPLLLAVLGFAGASAALVRTWVLRKAVASAT